MTIHYGWITKDSSGVRVRSWGLHCGCGYQPGDLISSNARKVECPKGKNLAKIDALAGRRR